MNNSKTPLRTSNLQSAMIVALEPIEFVPCGRHVISNHPGLSCLHLHHSLTAIRLDRSLVGSFSQVTLDERNKDSESWSLRMHNETEEELYVCGHTVVWSRGRNVISTYTIDTLIMQAIWCSFSLDAEDPHIYDLCKDSAKDGKNTVEGIAVVSDGSLHVYTRAGDDYITALPFQVRKVWNCRFGLIFERSSNQKEGISYGIGSAADAGSSAENALTTVFCLQHPLREFAPVIKKYQGGVRYMNRSRESIVFCEEDIVMTFDVKHGLHTVWKARKITSDDAGLLEHNVNQQQQLQNQVSSIRQMSLSSPGASPMRASFRGSPVGSMLHNMPGTSGHGVAKTPHSSRNPSFAHLSHTPSSTKYGSPMAPSLNYQSNAFSPLRHSPHLVRSPNTPISHESLCLNESVHESAEPLRPEICLEHVWSEGVTGTREGLNIGRATRAFVTKDVCGQRFLAYYIDNLRQLRLVKYGLSNDLVNQQLIFGAVTTIPARDAAPLKELNMMALLDMVGTVTLYTGIVKMVKMHISGVPMSSLSLSHGLRNATPSLGTPQPVSTPAHPSRPGSVLGNMDEVGLLSPVPELAYSGDADLSMLTVDEFPFSSTGHSSPILALPQVVGSGLLLELSNGSYYRSEVPSFCSTSLVRKCMKALDHVLPSDKYMQLAIKWFALRHSPGSMASFHSEWAIFEICLREIIGYSSAAKGRTNLSQFDGDSSISPVIAAKKARHLEEGNSGDWESLLQSNFHHKQSRLLSHARVQMSLKVTEQRKLEETKYDLMDRSGRRSSLDRSSDRTGGGVAHTLATVFSALHLVYEDQKLNVLTWKNIPLMSKFLQQLANDMGLVKFSRSYAMDNPSLIPDSLVESKEDAPQIYKLPSCFSVDLEPNVFFTLECLMKDSRCPAPFPIITGVTERTRQLITIYDRLFKEELLESSTVELGIFTKSIFRREKSMELEDQLVSKHLGPGSKNVWSFHRALQYMIQIGMKNEDLRTLPHGVALPILNALHRCKALPDLNLPNDALELIGRSDILKQNSQEMGKWQDAPLSTYTDPKRSAWQPTTGDSKGDNNKTEHEQDRDLIAAILDREHSINNSNNIEQSLQKTTKSQNPATVESADDNVTRLMFPNDHRVSEVRRLLQSTKSVKIDLTQQPGVSDHEFAEQTKARLLQLCNRTMALAIGRGMASLQMEKPSLTEPFQIPVMDLTGRGMPGNTTVALEGGGFEVPLSMKDWPFFHNGVAAGLQIMPQNDDSSWIYLNKPRSGNSQGPSRTIELSCEHAGFLLALGLNGHLEKLHKLNVHDYLSQTHEMTTVGLLLGLGASKCGTCDLTTMRLLSVHVPALLPPTSTEFDMPRLVQTAAVTAVGFLYLGSAQRLVAEVMLREIDRPPSPENDTGQDREAYALSCGLALGAITLGQGGGMPELADLNIPDQLFHYMTGRRRRTGELSTQSVILEGDQINTEVTAPGSVLALALMFLKTNNMAVAEWFTAPETLLLLEAIKPQHLMLRTMARALVLWDLVLPTKEWVDSHIPEVIRIHIKGSSGPPEEGTSDAESPEVDAQTVLQCHASILTGACLALGIRFAGSQNKGAYQTLHHYVLFFLSMWDEQSGGVRASSYPLEVMGRYTLETCLTTCLVALSMVVAGSGDLETLQICRFLHVRVGAEINYGMQMATHMALGFLFLGGCRQTLCTSNKAIVALLASVYPCFPCSSSDNQYHLQALRHFYVLATERRLLVPVDSVTNLPCYTFVSVKFLPMQPAEEEHAYTLMAPCMLPELSHLKEVSVDDPRHWPLSVDVQRQPSKLQNLLQVGMAVQRRTGYQPYIQDPQGHRSLLARSSDFNTPGLKWDSLLSDGAYDVGTFANVFLIQDDSKDSEGKELIEATNLSNLPSLLRSLVTQERTQALYIFYGLQEMCHQVKGSGQVSPLTMWQLRLAADFLRRKGSRGHADDVTEESTTSCFIELSHSELGQHFAKILTDIKPTLATLLGITHNQTGSTRPKRGVRRRDTLDLPGSVISFGVPTWTTELSPSHLWQLVAFVIYNGLPTSFLFPGVTSDDGKVGSDSAPVTDAKILSSLRLAGVHGSGGVQIFKALRT